MSYWEDENEKQRYDFAMTVSAVKSVFVHGFLTEPESAVNLHLN